MFCEDMTTGQSHPHDPTHRFINFAERSLVGCNTSFMNTVGLPRADLDVDFSIARGRGCGGRHASIKPVCLGLTPGVSRTGEASDRALSLAVCVVESRVGRARDQSGFVERATDMADSSIKGSWVLRSVVTGPGCSFSLCTA